MTSQKDWTVQLLDDAPHLIDEQDSARLKPVIDQLIPQLIESVNQRKSLCFGLFGGLGQGKSSIIQTLIEKPPLELKKLNIRQFNVANYRSESLEHELDRIIASWGLGWFLIKLLFSLLPIFIVALLILPENTDSTLLLAIATITGGLLSLAINRILLPSSKFLHRENERNFLKHVKKPFLIFKEVKNAFKVPDIFIIDDLDRANIKQQKAILRALHKLDQNITILISMDETALRLSKPDPENPEEFLRKIIDVECRIPHRVQEDNTFLTLCIAQESRKKNSNHHIIPHLLGNPVVISDLCRVISLLPNSSPRRVKRLLNDWLLRCSQSKVSHFEDASAILRLLGLYELHPPLRKDNETLIEILRDNEVESIEWYGQSHPMKSALLFNFFAATRSLRPLMRSWSAIIGHEKNSITLDYNNKNYNMVVLPESIEFDFEVVRKIRRTVYAITKGFGKLEFEPVSQLFSSHSGIKTQTPLDLGYLWPLIESALVHINSPEARNLWYQFFNHHITLQYTGAEQITLNYCLYRRWFGDTEALYSLSVDQRVSLIEKMKSTLSSHGYHLASLFPATLLPFLVRLSIVGDPGEESSRTLSLVRRWLKPISDEPLSESSTFKLTGSAMIDSAWPTIQKYSELQIHFKQLRRIAPLSLPQSLNTLLFDSDWFVDCCIQTPEEVLNAFFELFYNSDTEQWNIRIWQRWFDELDHQQQELFTEKSLMPLIKFARNCEKTDKHYLWETLFLLACLNSSGILLKGLLHRSNAKKLQYFNHISFLEQLLLIDNNPLWFQQSQQRLKALIWNDSLCYTNDILSRFQNVLLKKKGFYAFIFSDLEKSFTIPG